MQRREVLRGAAGLSVSAGAGAVVADPAEAAPANRAERILRERAPENWEYPFHALDSVITPVDQHYIRSHFATPVLERDTWRLRVEGAVDRPLDISYEELIRQPAKSAPVTLECAGNGRIYLQPSARGVQWEDGAVSTARWTGVSLAAILERAGIRGNAVDVVLEGADGGPSSNDLRPAGPLLRYARSIPRARALRDDVLLAYQMNGEPLPRPHGFPVRAMVPGWFGMASVKWLTRIVVTDQPFDGFWETVDYAFWKRRDGLPVRAPITEMLVKAAIARPVLRENVPAGKRYRINGAAWTSDAEISRVEVSTDGGKSWRDARLLDRHQVNAWRLWELDWRVPEQRGPVVLMARATDSRGRTQPTERDPDRGNYMVNHVVPIEVAIS